MLGDRPNGFFLVRESQNYKGDYTLCVRYVGVGEHERYANFDILLGFEPRWLEFESTSCSIPLNYNVLELLCIGALNSSILYVDVYRTMCGCIASTYSQ